MAIYTGLDLSCEIVRSKEASAIHYIPQSRTCTKCKQRKPQKNGSYRFDIFKNKRFLCADCK